MKNFSGLSFLSAYPEQFSLKYVSPYFNHLLELFANLRWTVSASRSNLLQSIKQIPWHGKQSHVDMPADIPEAVNARRHKTWTNGLVTRILLEKEQQMLTVFSF